MALNVITTSSRAEGFVSPFPESLRYFALEPYSKRERCHLHWHPGAIIGIVVGLVSEESGAAVPERER